MGQMNVIVQRRRVTSHQNLLSCLGKVPMLFSVLELEEIKTNAELYNLCRTARAETAETSNSYKIPIFTFYVKDQKSGSISQLINKNVDNPKQGSS